MAEAVHQEILRWPLNLHQKEPQALRKLVARSAQQTRQWTGCLLEELGSAYSYSSSVDATTQTIDKTIHI